MPPTVRTWSDEGLAWIEIDRPGKLNALDGDTVRALTGAVQDAAAQPETRVILLAASGDKAFAAGADVAEMHAQDAAGVRALMESGKALAVLLEEAPVPVIAVVHGFVLGGGLELALACDLICAAETARFGLPEADLGVLPGWGGSQRLLRRVGAGRARDMLLTGRRVPAEEALSWGLCDRVFPAASLREAAAALARSLRDKEAAALAAAKRTLREGAGLPLFEALRLETELFVQLFDRPERAERMERFLKPRSQ
jgi:enoyl-CoA hydratase